MYVNGKCQHTRSDLTWANMRNRCKNDGIVYPSYVGCAMSENFKDFQYFVNWHRNQIGYSLPDYDLDKDILYAGNLLYSESTCVKIPHFLNTFTKGQTRVKDGLKQGVTEFKGRYMSQISIDGVNKYLGLFATEDLAHEVYVNAKEAEAKRWYLRLIAKEFIVDQRVIERMRVWTFTKGVE